MSLAKNIDTILDEASVFMLFLAPPAWGKTTLLIELFKQGRRKIIYLSPLRALANEFYGRISEDKGTFLLQSGDESESHEAQFHKFKEIDCGVLVTTPELFKFSYFTEIECEKEHYLFVFDEFHLFYYWGESFREHLFEMMMKVACDGHTAFAITATMDKPLIEKFRKDFLLNYESLYEMDLGNGQLKKEPRESYSFTLLGKKRFNRIFIKKLRESDDQTYIFFCQYRREVDQWTDFAKRKGIVALGCKGGETAQFMKSLEQLKGEKKGSGVDSLRCIFTTLSLSHGVNLPNISKVFINSKIESRDFHIQMIGRGGREGGEYEVYHFNEDNKGLKNRLRNMIYLLVQDFIYTVSLWSKYS